MNFAEGINFLLSFQKDKNILGTEPQPKPQPQPNCFDLLVSGENMYNNIFINIYTVYSF